ncbi:MAG: hypothetical protein Q9221_004171 [Calogaya cf. arnoldii]
MTYKGPDGVGENGTVQNIFEKLGDAAPKVEIAKREDKTDTLEARDKPKHSTNVVTGIQCNPGGDSASVEEIKEGIEKLKKLGGECYVNPRSCAKISCEWRSAIFLCNDRDDIIAPNCKLLARDAEDILGACPRIDSGPQDIDDDGLKGQKFDRDNYNVVIKRDKC